MGVRSTQGNEKHADREIVYTLPDQVTVGAPYLAERDVGGMLNCSLLTGRDHFYPRGMAAQDHRSHISLREIWGTHSLPPSE